MLGGIQNSVVQLCAAQVGTALVHVELFLDYFEVVFVLFFADLFLELLVENSVLHLGAPRHFSLSNLCVSKTLGNFLLLLRDVSYKFLLQLRGEFRTKYLVKFLLRE